MKYAPWTLVPALVASGIASAQPTYMLKDISPGDEGTTFPFEFTPVSGDGLVPDRLLFFTHDPPGLWETEGTPGTTRKLLDIDGECEGIRFGEICYPAHLTENGYFANSDPEHGVELWRTDGTAGGTGLVEDIRPGPAHSLHDTFGFTGGFAPVDEDLLLFRADDGVHGSNRLWASRGAAGNTSMILDLPVDRITRVDEGLAFFVSGGVWGTGGTSESTHRIATFQSVSSPFVPLNGEVFFLARDASGLGLWKIPVTGFPQVAATRVAPLPLTLDSQDMVEVGGTLFFTLRDESVSPHRASLWASNGTAGGTRVLLGLEQGVIDNLTGVRGTLFFRHWDPIGGFRIEKSDGTPAGTVPVKAFPDSMPDHLARGNHALYFTSNDVDTGLWTSDGTPGGTVRIEEGGHDQLTESGDFLYFIGRDLIHSFELWTLPLQPTCEDELADPDDAVVIIDNAGPGTSKTGSWQPSDAPGFFGTNSVWARPSSLIPAFTFTVALPVHGVWDVSEWHTIFSSRTLSARHVIARAGGTSTVFVNQSVGGGRWNSLGEFAFRGTGAVTIRAEDGLRSTNADAVRFVCEEPARPVAKIDAMAPRPAEEGKTVCFQGHGEPAVPGDPAFAIVAHEWGSSVEPAGLIGAQASFCVPQLVPGLHTIVYRVQDARGAWSLPAIETLEVRPGEGVDVVIDNRDAGTSSVGVWHASSTAGFFATDSVWAKPSTNTGNTRFTFTATLRPERERRQVESANHVPPRGPGHRHHRRHGHGAQHERRCGAVRVEVLRLSGRGPRATAWFAGTSAGSPPWIGTPSGPPARARSGT